MEYAVHRGAVSMLCRTGLDIETRVKVPAFAEPVTIKIKINQTNLPVHLVPYSCNSYLL